MTQHKMTKIPVLFLIILCFCVIAGSSFKCRKNILEKGLTKLERNLIVKTHNKFRRAIEKGEVKEQPRSVKMNRLKWDRRLAKAAQKISDTCKFDHVDVKDSRWPVGQNLFKSSSTIKERLNVTSAIFVWFNEYKNYKYPFYTKKTGHYTQVIWANTRYIGCGYTHYKTTGKFKYHKILVCNYGPAGNVQGQAPYKQRP